MAQGLTHLFVFTFRWLWFSSHFYLLHHANQAHKSYCWQVSSKVIWQALIFEYVLQQLFINSKILIYFCNIFRGCIRNWCPVEYIKEGYPIIWEIHGTAETILPRLQVREKKTCDFIFLINSQVNDQQGKAHKQK